MKSKQNSKSKKPTTTKQTLLVTQQPPSIKSIDIKCTSLILSSRHLTSVTGIGQYRELKHIDLSNNDISQYSSLRDLRYCQKLETINVQHNPICFRPNFMYGIMDVLGRNVCVNGLRVEVGWSVLKAWQMENGYKIAVFLLQCCILFDSILNKTKTQNKQKIKSQLQPLKHSLQLHLNPTMPSSSILHLNQTINKYLPLEQIQQPQFTQQQMQQIKDYFIQKLIENDGKNNKFIYKILDNIEVVDEEEQKQLIQQVQVTKIIVKQYIGREFQGFWGNGAYGAYGKQGMQGGGKHGGDQAMASVKHFTSADTALDTYDTAVRSNTCVYKYGLHFCMDLEYLESATRVLLNQIERLQQIIEQQLKTQIQDNIIHHNKTLLFSNKHKQPQQQILKKSFDNKQVDRSNSPIHIYNNSMILCNLLKVLQTPIKRVIFRKIKNSKNKQLITNMVTSLECCLSNSLLNLIRVGFYYLKQTYLYESKIITGFKQNRLSIMFKLWKSIKKRKLKLLKNIVKRKIKGDTFMLAVMITKWKINSRADRIKRMASAAILGTRVNSMPKSKKGVELAYKRTIANRQIKLI